ncbi:MAG: extracellular solute-binding protein [Rheinheimera sp.]|nr:extracellular solute-binding protein [Rheinheimera sp.]
MRIFFPFCCMLMSSCCSAVTQLNVWHMLKEMDADFIATTAAFSKANPDIKVSVYLLPNEELKASAIRAVEQNVAPDVIIISSDNVGYAHLMKLSALPADMIDTAMPAADAQALAFNDTHYSIPLFTGNHLLMLYNKALVKTPATDWQQLSLQQPGFEQQGVHTLALNFQEPYWFALIASLFDAELTQDGKVSLNTAPMQQALQFYRHLSQSGLANMHCSYRCVSDDFYQGRYAYAVNGVWALASARAQMGDNLGVMLFPQLQQRFIKPLSSYIVMIFPNNSLRSAKAKQIKQLVAFMRQPQNLQPLAQKHFLAPYYLADPMQLKPADPIYAAVLAQSRLSQLMPASTAMVSVWNGLHKGLLLYLNNTLDAAAATELMQKVATRDQHLLEAGL